MDIDLSKISTIYFLINLLETYIKDQFLFSGRALFLSLWHVMIWNLNILDMDLLEMYRLPYFKNQVKI
ncbi:hypothetical protein AB432_027805 [Brevibacillus brevis]|uniref:Uncharacterized protein n=1 Tax=Brevibacillus brevis TaxID=1393 RepID=A0A2Z4MQ01_BREBE|nr:hypothetical protein AB432_027805 [Brevibacillus brevis]